ncbi:MAG: TIGR00730 family Rossman fold protein [Ruminococcus sp.]|nr:TIGR00730 family Rossman fold protein [Ruminococcus sp.]
MNICVFGSSSEQIDKIHLDSAQSLGAAIAAEGWGLIFGAGKYGVMGAVARGAAEKNGVIIGVSPDFFKELNVLRYDCTELIFTETMRERKRVMEDMADAFVICPGGIGTFEEFFEVITLKQLQQHTKPIIIYNVDGYYDPMLDMMKKSVDQQFMREDTHSLYKVVDIEQEVLNAIKDYVPFQYNKYNKPEKKNG